ncbi:MAG: glycosyltransferase family 39 protein, partial [Nanoarchaeota archaeon]|nr:glycosyltransferase family 39 protein [Nanoarchaeota archaeon]
MFKAGLENYLSPDETVYKFFIDNFRETNNLYSEEDLNVKSIDIFHPRNAYTNGDKVFPTGFIGIIFTYGLFSYFSNLNLVTTIIFLLGVFYVYKLSTLFFKQKTSITVSLLYSISPIILLFSLRIYYNNMPAFVFFLIGAYYYLRDTSYKDFFLTGVFWSLAIFFRNTYIVFIFVSVVLYFLITLRKEHIFEKFLKHIIIGIFVFFSVLQIFLINTLIFGSALENQYSNNDDLEGSSLLGKIGWFFMTSGFDPQRLYSNFTDYIVKFFFPLSLFIVISSIYCFKKRKNLEPKSSTKLIFIFIYLTYKIIFYYTGVYYGMSFADLTLSSSY